MLQFLLRTVWNWDDVCSKEYSCEIVSTLLLLFGITIECVLYSSDQPSETTLNETSTNSLNQDTEAYPIQMEPKLNRRHPDIDDQRAEKMLLKCRSCKKVFDSTFTREEFSSLSIDQNESGTLHLCPHCGNLAIYLLKDYFENENT